MFQRTISSLIFAAATFGATAAFAQVAPDALIKQVAGDVIESVKNDKAIQAGDISRIQGLVDTQVLPHVDLQHMTAAVVGRAWKTATPDQQATRPFEAPCSLNAAAAQSSPQSVRCTVMPRPGKARICSATAGSQLSSRPASTRSPIRSA